MDDYVVNSLLLAAVFVRLPSCTYSIFISTVPSSWSFEWKFFRLQVAIIGIRSAAALRCILFLTEQMLKLIGSRHHLILVIVV